jgi:ATP-binding cassette subfamily B protein
VLHDISFQLQPGSVLGLLGRTGSGKTTLTRLLFRLYDPANGSISIDQQDIRGLDLQNLRRQIGIVTQEVQLFRASVRDNLTFFDGSITDTQILTALEELELGGWLRGLPNGLDTLLAAGGHSLSAGEAQLLAFARIFLRSPGLIILDEASSRLDPATEARIEQAIDRLLRGRTAIIVAHRLGTVMRSDQILILEDGQIAEFGPRLRLMENPEAKFSRLLKTGLEEVLV